MPAAGVVLPNRRAPDSIAPSGGKSGSLRPVATQPLTHSGNILVPLSDAQSTEVECEQNELRCGWQRERERRGTNSSDRIANRISYN